MRARVPLLVFLAALAYFLLFHRTGLFLQDEGVIAYQALRVSQGQLPYADFQTAYTPAAFYLHALLFKIFGPSLALLRVAGSFACAATTTLLLMAAARVLPAPYVLLPSVLYMLLEDQESKGFVVHTIAYPARYVQTLWVLSLCLTLAHARRPGWLVTAALGAVAAAIIAFKHTAGIYNVWAAGLSLVLLGHWRGVPVQGMRALAIVPLGFLLAVLAALPVLIGGLGGVQQVVLIAFYLPLVVAVVMMLPGAFPWSRDARERERRRSLLSTTGTGLVVCAAAALVPTALWVAYFAVRVGGPVLLQRLILDGPAAAHSFIVPLPPPQPLTVGVAILIAAVLGERTLLRRGWLSGPAASRGLGGVTSLLVGTGLLWVAWLLRETWHAGEWRLALMHVGRGLDNLGFYLVFVVGYAFLPRLWASARQRRDIDLVALCWVHGMCQLLLVFPRMDIAHLYEGAVILLIPGTVLLERALAFFRARAPGRARWLPVGATCALAIVGAVKLVPRVDTQIAWHGGVVPAPRTTLGGRGGGLYATGRDAELLAALNRTVAFLVSRTAPGTPIFAYPALPVIYFLSGHENPSAFDYFYCGFGEGRDELAVMTALERTQVPLVIMRNDQSFDPESAGFFPMLKDYLARHFVERESFADRESFAPFRVLQRVTP